MSVIRFGIDFIDKHIESLVGKGIYFLMEHGTYARSSFIYHILQTHLLLSNSCLYITNFDRIRENDIIKKNLDSFLQFPNLTILEIPLYISEYIKSTADLTKCLDDLKIYVDNINPSLIIIQSVELLLDEGKGSVNKTLLSLFLFFLYNIEATVLIEITDFDQQDLLICEKYLSGIFDLHISETYQNYQLVFKSFKKIKNNSSIVFSLDALCHVIPPIYKISSSISLHDFKQIVLQKSLHEYEPQLLDVFQNRVSILQFETMNDLYSLTIDPRQALFIISSVDETLSGWDLLKWLKMTYPLVRILFAGSQFLPIYQKVRAQRFGADRFLPLPIKSEELLSILVDMYQHEGDEQLKQFCHKVFHVSDDFIIANKSALIYKDALSRYIKDFAFSMVTVGKTIHFYRFYTPETSVFDFIDTLKSFPNLCFISSFYIENNHLLFLIFKSLTDAESTNVREYLTRFALTEPKNYADKPIVATSNSVWELKRFVYPIDSSNIESVMDWIYDAN